MVWNKTTLPHEGTKAPDDGRPSFLAPKMYCCSVGVIVALSQSLVYLYSVKTGIKKIETKDFRTVEMC